MQKCSFGDSLPRLFKPFGFVKKHGRQGAGLIFPIYLYKKLNNSSCQKSLDQLLYNFAELFLCDSVQRLFRPFGLSKNMAARGWGLFSLYIFIENLKNLLVRNHWTNFIITWQNVSMVTLYQDCSSNCDSSKNMAARGRGLFSLCIYIKNFKNFLLRNRWTEFNVTWQECCFGDPLPRLFKPS